MPVMHAPLIGFPPDAAFLLDAPLVHDWDDDDPLAGIGLPDPEVEAMLGGVGDWGKFAYSLGCADWVLARVGRFSSGDWPWWFRDACWAFELDAAFMLPPEIEDHPQEGPVDGPICLALTTVLNTRYGFDEGNAEIDAAMADQIVLQVLPDPQPFLRWRAIVLPRLAKATAADVGRLAIDVLDAGAEAPPWRALAASLQRLVLDGNPYARRLPSIGQPARR